MSVLLDQLLADESQQQPEPLPELPLFVLTDEMVAGADDTSELVEARDA